MVTPVSGSTVPWRTENLADLRKGGCEGWSDSVVRVHTVEAERTVRREMISKTTVPSGTCG